VSSIFTVIEALCQPNPAGESGDPEMAFVLSEKIPTFF
jgi:hypothetical protein